MISKCIEKGVIGAATRTNIECCESELPAAVRNSYSYFAAVEYTMPVYGEEATW